MKSPRSRSSTPRSARRLKRWCGLNLATLTAAMLQGCATPSTPPSLVGPSPLVTASCPQISPLSDDSFAATTLKLIELANQYRECREAALAGQPIGKPDYSLKR